MDGWDPKGVVQQSQELCDWMDEKGLTEAEKGALLGIAVVRLALSTRKPIEVAKAIVDTVMIGVKVGVDRGIVPPETMRERP